MKKENLVLFTKTYPFGSGEQYITNELEYLAKDFNKVIIYPNDYYSKENKHSRSLPENVEVLNLNQNLGSIKSKKINDVFLLFKATVTEFLRTDDRESFFKNFKWNLINFWSQLQLAKVFSKYLHDNNLNSTNTILYSYWFHKSAILLAILKDKKQIDKFVSRAHSVDLYHDKWGLINENVKVPPFKHFKLKHVDRLFSVSNHGEKFLKNSFPNFRQKFSTSYLGVKSIEGNLSKNYNNAFHIVTCSGIDENKRVHELAKALLQINSQVVWTHFGTGRLLNVVEKVASEFPNNIVYQYKGTVSNNEIKEFYASNEINLFVNLSIVEGLPVSVMEAMMFEIPILATAVYGTPEAVIDGKNGFLLDVNFSQQQLSDKLNYCIKHKEKLAEMGKASQEIFLSKFIAEKNYMEFANLLTSL